MRGPIWNIALGVGLGAYGIIDRLRTGRWRQDLRTRRGRVRTPPAAGRPRILVHGVSVGEVMALEPLVRELKSADGSPDVVVSAATESGYEQAVGKYGDQHTVVRFPMDFTWMVDRFLEAVDPDLVVLAELEMWPAFLKACKQRSVPVCLVNARLADSSYRRYRRLRPLVAGMFSHLALVACQDEGYRDQLIALGTEPDRTVVVGNLKWDAAQLRRDPDAAQALGRALGIDPDRPLVVAGSTGPGEEDRLLKALPRETQLLLAPRRPDRWDEVASLRRGMPRRSQLQDGAVGAPGSDVFLLDTIGELGAAYALADVAFVGRSLIPMGGSNPLESVALGKPTVIGPHFENFAAVVANLESVGGIVVSADPIEQIGLWLADPSAAREVSRAGLDAVARNQGTATRTAELVLAQLRPPVPVSRPAG